MPRDQWQYFGATLTYHEQPGSSEEVPQEPLECIGTGPQCAAVVYQGEWKGKFHYQLYFETTKAMGRSSAQAAVGLPPTPKGAKGLPYSVHVAPREQFSSKECAAAYCCSTWYCHRCHVGDHSEHPTPPGSLVWPNRPDEDPSSGQDQLVDGPHDSWRNHTKCLIEKDIKDANGKILFEKGQSAFHEKGKCTPSWMLGAFLPEGTARPNNGRPLSEEKEAREAEKKEKKEQCEEDLKEALIMANTDSAEKAMAWLTGKQPMLVARTYSNLFQMFKAAAKKIRPKWEVPDYDPKKVKMWRWQQVLWDHICQPPSARRIFWITGDVDAGKSWMYNYIERNYQYGVYDAGKAASMDNCLYFYDEQGVVLWDLPMNFEYSKFEDLLATAMEKFSDFGQTCQAKKYHGKTVTVRCHVVVFANRPCLEGLMHRDIVSIHAQRDSDHADKKRKILQPVESPSEPAADGHAWSHNAEGWIQVPLQPPLEKLPGEHMPRHKNGRLK